MADNTVRPVIHAGCFNHSDNFFGWLFEVLQKLPNCAAFVAHCLNKSTIIECASSLSCSVTYTPNSPFYADSNISCRVCVVLSSGISSIRFTFMSSSDSIFLDYDVLSSQCRTRSSGQMEERQSERQDTRGPGRRSRDEELARQYALPASAAQISSMPLIELNRLMHTAQLSQVQQHIVRKIRRRGMLLELLPPQRYYACNLSLINSQQKTSFNDLYRKNPSLFIGIRPNRSSANCHATSLFLSMSNLA